MVTTALPVGQRTQYFEDALLPSESDSWIEVEVVGVSGIVGGGVREANVVGVREELWEGDLFCERRCESLCVCGYLCVCVIKV